MNIVGLGTFAIASAYLNTAGNDSLTVSTFQAVQVVVVRQITGLFVNRVATLYLPEIFPADSLVASIPAGGNPVSFNIQVPDTTTGIWEQLRVRIRGTSQINPYVTLADTADLFIFVEKRAAMVMRSTIVDPEFTF